MAEEENKRDSGILRKAFGFFGEIYFRIINHPYLSKNYTKQLNTNAELSGKVGMLSQRVANVSGQYEAEKDKVERLTLENGGKSNTITRLSDVVNELTTSVREINEQRECLAEEIVKTQEQIQAYQQGVLGSPEYQELIELRKQAEERASGLETRISELEKSKKDLDGLYAHQKQINLRLQKEFRNTYERYTQEKENSIITRARGSDRKLSYIYVRGFDEILVVTQEFEGKYHFDNEKIKGRKYSDVLQNANSQVIKALRKFFTDPEEKKLQTVIIDGEKKERVIYFVKHAPEVVLGLIPDDEGKLVEHRTYYTRVDVHDFGLLEKTKEGLLRIIHYDGAPRTLQEFVEQQTRREIQEDKIHAEIEKSFPEWASRGLTVKELEEVERGYKDYEDFMSQVARLLSDKGTEKSEPKARKSRGFFKRKKSEEKTEEEKPA